MWALDIGQRIFQNRSPSNVGSMFIKAGDSETKEGLRVEDATGESLGGALLWLLEVLSERTEPGKGLLLAHRRVWGEGFLGDRFKW